jgi:hypothetical protein
MKVLIPLIFCIVACAPQTVPTQSAPDSLLEQSQESAEVPAMEEMCRPQIFKSRPYLREVVQRLDKRQTDASDDMDLRAYRTALASCSDGDTEPRIGLESVPPQPKE